MMPSPKNPSFATRFAPDEVVTNVEDVGIQHDLEADGGGHHDAVPQSKAKEFCLIGDGHGSGCRRDRDVLHADHLAHYTAGGVGGCHKGRLKSETAGRHHLQIAEERICRGIGAGQKDTQPTEQGAEEGKHPARRRKTQVQAWRSRRNSS